GRKGQRQEAARESEPHSGSDCMLAGEDRSVAHEVPPDFVLDPNYLPRDGSVRKHTLQRSRGNGAAGGATATGGIRPAIPFVYDIGTISAVTGGSNRGKRSCRIPACHAPAGARTTCSRSQPLLPSHSFARAPRAPMRPSTRARPRRSMPASTTSSPG